MPNWCFNSLLIEGSEKDIADVKAQLNQPFEREHESWNMQTNTMEKKIHKFDNPIFSFWNIRRPTDLEAYNKQPEHAPLAEAVLHLGNSWYDFNNREWGTKWDVAVENDEKYPDTELAEESKDFLLYKFNTAWAPPISAIEKLSQQYPELEIELEYEEEQGWGGTTVFANGEGTEVESYSARCNNCLYVFVDDIPMCDECQAEVCPECNYNLMEGDICEHQLVK
jgi:hypothetical protein